MQPPRWRILLRRSLEWLFCLIIIPVLLLAAVEGGLRLAGYGKNVSPFLRRQFDGQTVYVRNDAYIQQFFTYRVPAEQWRKAAFAVPKNKSPNTYRVFVLGSSAARGWPSYECSFSRFLHAMLQARYPNTRFEMYNCSYEGTNSHVMRGMANACSVLKPDLFVVYMGNNEFHGPFGLVMNYQNIGAIRGIWDIRLRIWLNRFRIYQTIAGRYPPRLTTQQALKFPTVRMHATPDEAETIYANYERNLHDICDAASRAGAKVILSTVGANLRHWMPTGVTHEPPLAPEVKSQWDACYEAGLRLQAKGAFSEALAEYAKAAALDQGHALFQFHRAECFLHAGDYENARQCFIQALDLDDCNWVRAKTIINEIVRRVAAKRAEDGVVLADVAGWLEERSPHRITGLEFFIDGCHFNVEGSYEVARAIFDVMPACLPASFRAQAPEHAEPLSLTECKSRLGIRDSTVIDTYRRVIETDQRLGVEALDVLKEKVAVLERNAVPVANEDVHTLFARAAQVFPQDFLVRREHAQLLFWSADKEVCVAEARRLVEDFPGYRDALRLLAEALANAGHFEDALARFKELTRLYPDDADLIADWGQTTLKQGNAEAALELARRALQIEPKCVSAACCEAGALAAMGRSKEAFELCRMLLAQDPNNEEPFRVIENWYVEHNDADGRVKEIGDIAATYPDSAVAQNFLGAALRAAGRLDEAASAYRKAADLAPHDLRPLINWARTLLDQGDAYAAAGETERALVVYRQAGEVPPVRIRAVTREAEMLAKLDRLAEAVQLCVTLIAEDTSAEQGYLELNNLLSSSGETAECVALFASLAAKHFESAMAHFYYAEALSAAKDWTGAIAEYQRAAEITPQDARIADGLNRANEQLRGAAVPLSSRTP